MCFWEVPPWLWLKCLHQPNLQNVRGIHDLRLAQRRRSSLSRPQQSTLQVNLNGGLPHQQARSVLDSVALLPTCRASKSRSGVSSVWAARPLSHRTVFRHLIFHLAKHVATYQMFHSSMCMRLGRPPKEQGQIYQKTFNKPFGPGVSLFQNAPTWIVWG